MKIADLNLDGNVFLAPMAGITDAPFRRIVQHFGVSGVWTEMISAHAALRSRKSLETTNLEGHHVPTVFQIVGKDPSIMSEAAHLLQGLGASAIDLNMGCPARKVVGSGSGVALMKDIDLAQRIIASVRRSISIPLTVKMRSGWDEKNFTAPELAALAQDEGVDALIVHGRTRSAVHSGPVSADLIALIKSRAKIPIIANGGINSVEDALNLINSSKCDGIMIGRGALGRPWFPEMVRLILQKKEKVFFNLSVSDTIVQHFVDQIQTFGDQVGVRRMRKHLGWYSKGFANGADFRFKVFREMDPCAILDLVRNFFGKVAIS
ncbi:MAG: tRNA dihydrouridine synthase DusB [Desulfomonilaceae bacterium]